MRPALLLLIAALPLRPMSCDASEADPTLVDSDGDGYLNCPTDMVAFGKRCYDSDFFENWFQASDSHIYEVMGNTQVVGNPGVVLFEEVDSSTDNNVFIRMVTVEPVKSDNTCHDLTCRFGYRVIDVAESKTYNARGYFPSYEQKHYTTSAINIGGEVRAVKAFVKSLEFSSASDFYTTCDLFSCVDHDAPDVYYASGEEEEEGPTTWNGTCGSGKKVTKKFKKKVDDKCGDLSDAATVTGAGIGGAAGFLGTSWTGPGSVGGALSGAFAGGAAGASAVNLGCAAVKIGAAMLCTASKDPDQLCSVAPHVCGD